jgi:hypothetical protein
MASRILAKQAGKSKPAKPDKPYDGFPLTPHDSGKWCKQARCFGTRVCGSF